MSKIEFPKKLEKLLKGSAYEAPIRALADQIAEIVADNKLPFFPDYTDHGTDHINSVLKSQVELVPRDVWNQSKEDSDPRLLCDADAAVIIGATLLHDIAMHLHPAGFLELISKRSRFAPLPWFKQSAEDHAADLPWFELWDQFAREARRFSDRALANIIGLDSVQSDWKFTSLPEEIGRWEENHFRIVGEFLRRHHARLAHEIAIYGFPGLEAGGGEHQFPAMGQEAGHKLRPLADLIGLTARSHGLSLRVCLAYLESEYQGVPRPMRTAVLYPMALLRVADYLQIDRLRAPPVLLQLKDPQSPISVLEWEKHRAVEQVGPAKDPRGKMVTVGRDVGLATYLQLKDLLAGIQFELDHSTAVLDEAYGTWEKLGLNQLGLVTRRVYSNLHSPVFRNCLPYVPEKTGFSADPNLLSLLVKPLYGNEPGVGIRELMQNSVDAVRELEVWCKNHGVEKAAIDLPDQEADVLIEYIQQENGSWLLRIQDKGIGMTVETIQNFFLRAGASFRQSSAWAKEFLENDGSSRVLRAGRFGVGAFAIFLLGPVFRVWTRHASAGSEEGYCFVASADSEDVEILLDSGVKVGTLIEIDLPQGTVSNFQLEALDRKVVEFRKKVDWYCWSWPKVSQKVVRSGAKIEISQKFSAPLPENGASTEWFLIQAGRYGKVHWTFGNWPRLTCSGVRIGPQTEPNFSVDSSIGWSRGMKLLAPSISVADPEANLPLTVKRHCLVESKLPFIEVLQRDVLMSFIAHALVCGPANCIESMGRRMMHPLSYFVRHDYSDSGLISNKQFLWCSTLHQMVPSDPWLYSLLSADRCVIAGVLSRDRKVSSPEFPGGRLSGLLRSRERAVINLDISIEKISERKFLSEMKSRLEGLVCASVPALDRSSDCGRVVFLVDSRDHNLANISKKIFRKRWQRIGVDFSRSSRGLRYEFQVGKCLDFNGPEELLGELEGSWKLPLNVAIRFVAELGFKKYSIYPESLLAKIWNECLGPSAIPFDPKRRQELMTRGRRHAELKRHIEAWEEMKRTGSKWITYQGD